MGGLISNLPLSRRASHVLNLLWKHGSLAKYDLMKMTRYGASTVTSIVDLLESLGLITYTEPVVAGAGRPPIPIMLRRDAAMAVGAEFHRYGVTAVVCDLGQTILRECTHPVTDPDDRAAILRDVCACIDEATNGIDRDRLIGIGLGLPGTVDSKSGIGRYYCYMPGWRDVPVKDFFEVRYGLPVSVDNNIRAAALGETIAGSARGYSSVVFIGGRTGIGSGIVLGGQIYSGKTGLAGEVGHMPVERSGPKCRCGKRGCLETLASTPAIIARAARILESRSKLSRDEAPPNPPAIEDVWQMSREGDEEIRAELREVADYLALGCISINLMFDPEVIAHGGDYVLGGDEFIDWLKESITKANGSLGVEPARLVMSKLGRSANAVGASCLAVQSATNMFFPGCQEGS